MIVSGRRFERVFDRDSGRVVSDTAFVDCIFDNCAFSLTQDLLKRSTARNVTFNNTVAVNCNVGPAVIEDVTIQHLDTGDILIVWSPFLKHVVLKGKIRALKINSVPTVVNTTTEVAETFARARSDYYAAVDWALDIREAIFTEFTARGIPASLVRRDPETQVVVTREKAIRSEWRRNLPSWNSYWADVIDIFLARDDAAHILVAPKGIPKKRHRKMVEGLRNLQDIGVAEPD